MRSSKDLHSSSYGTYAFEMLILYFIFIKRLETLLSSGKFVVIYIFATKEHVVRISCKAML